MKLGYPGSYAARAHPPCSCACCGRGARRNAALPCRGKLGSLNHEVQHLSQQAAEADGVDRELQHRKHLLSKVYQLVSQTQV